MSLGQIPAIAMTHQQKFWRRLESEQEHARRFY